jgi:small subunit ribosomal protein S17
MKKRQEILGVKVPKENCTDKKCPFHGEINVKKELLQGRVVKKQVNRSATIEWSRTRSVPKYERYEIRKSRLNVHNPLCVDAKIGDLVTVARTRPLSKTKNHIIIKITSSNKNKEEDNHKKSTKDKTVKKLESKEEKNESS